MNFSYAMLATLQEANGKIISTALRISGDMLNIDYLNLKALRKRISCFILKSVLCLQLRT